MPAILGRSEPHSARAQPGGALRRGALDKPSGLSRSDPTRPRSPILRKKLEARIESIALTDLPNYCNLNRQWYDSNRHGSTGLSRGPVFLPLL